MDALSILFALLFYAASAVFVYGLYAKIRQYWRTPAPLKIPTTPAPTTQTGVVARTAREVVLFESLFSGPVVRLVISRRPAAGVSAPSGFVIESVPQPLLWVQFFGLYAAFVMSVGLAGLLVRRVAVAFRLSDVTIAARVSAEWPCHEVRGATDVVAVKASGGPVDVLLAAVACGWSVVTASVAFRRADADFPIQQVVARAWHVLQPTRNQVDNPANKGMSLAGRRSWNVNGCEIRRRAARRLSGRTSACAGRDGS